MSEVIETAVTLSEDGKCMTRQTIFDNGVVTTDFCAVGRSSEWPQQMITMRPFRKERSEHYLINRYDDMLGEWNR